MDRRQFLKTMTQAAAVAGAAQVLSEAGAGMPERLTIAAVGDCIPGRRLSQEPSDGLLEVAELLRGADYAWANCETVFLEPRHAVPAYKGSGATTICEPWGADELAWMGIDFVGTANNHTMDWGAEGLLSTLTNLERVGIAHAGAGRDLAAAARPGYADGAAGRVGQVNCSATCLPYFAAGPAHPYVLGRPGLNHLRVERKLQVDHDLFKRFKALDEKLNELTGSAEVTELFKELFGEIPDDVVYLDSTMVVAGDEVALLSAPNPADVERITGAIGIARNNSRVVVATLHSHDWGRRVTSPDAYVEAFAHAVIDAGADLVFAAGPHILRGIEIYQGKPIFYSLSNFIFHYESRQDVPAEGYTAVGLDQNTLDPSLRAARIPYWRQERFWQTVVPRITLEGGTERGSAGPRVVSVELFPVTLGWGEPVYRSGTPEMAHAGAAAAILEQVAALSAPYGTSIRVRGDVGWIELG